MIVTEVFYGIKCNRCGEISSDGEHSFWSDESSAEENAMESEWIEVNNKHFCTECYEYHEDKDESVPLPDFPAEVKTIQKFLKYNILGYCNEIKENENVFTLTKSLYNRSMLSGYEEDYIKGVLGGALVSIEYKKNDRYTRNDCVITISKTT